IRMTRDGELVISHDETLARLTPCKRVVETMTADEIRKVKTNQGNDLIFLPELVDFFADKDNVYIEFEMKTKPVESYPEERLREYCEKVYNTVMAKKPANSLYLFTSSDKRALKMMRSLHPDVDLLLIISKPICEETILEAIDMGIKRLGCRIEGTSKAMVDLAHKAGLYVSLWPGQSPEEFMRGAYLGADALNSDRAVEVKNWLDKNAPWIKYK
ncbi:MAG TPA: glycerophosphodiester phosphodiesterase, partial [Alistipes obesi]|nr:glycerophosphodiester phosphodiesterase [Alistipes communis]